MPLSGVIAEDERDAAVGAAGARSSSGRVTLQVQVFDEQGHVRPLEDIENDVMRHAIAACGGNLAAAARALGIGRSTLHRHISARVAKSDRSELSPPRTHSPES